jgi:hypothetical protein
MRPGAEGMAEMQHAVTLGLCQRQPLAVVISALSGNAARDIWRDLAHGENLIGIERHPGGGAAIGPQKFGGAADQFAVAVKVALDLDDESTSARRSPSDIIRSGVSLKATAFSSAAVLERRGPLPSVRRPSSSS